MEPLGFPTCATVSLWSWLGPWVHILGEISLLWTALHGSKVLLGPFAYLMLLNLLSLLYEGGN